MAAIQPNSDIWLLSDVPLDNTYQHTAWFSSPSDQQVMFAAKRKQGFNDQSYQRVHRNKIRLQCNADDIYDCNYLMFRNTSFGNKWFYAFITEVEYINNVVSEITYEIDVMQTWMFDYDLKPCYVEREHSRTDSIGDNYVPEPLQVGEYVANSEIRIDGTEGVVVIVGLVNTQNSTSGHSYGRVYGGATLVAFDFTYGDAAIDAINSLLDEYTAQPDSIVTMYIAPKILIEAEFDPDTHRADLTSSDIITTEITRSLDAITIGDSLNGYIPKNNKMYTYPYNYLQLTNGQGNGIITRYEFFRNNQPNFALYGCVTQPVELVIRPYNYKGITNMQMTESLAIKNYPMCSWNVDAYQAWVAQNSVPIGLDTAAWSIASVGSMLVNPLLGTGVAIAAVSKIGNLLTENYKASIAADQLRGSLQTASPNLSIGANGFYALRMSVSNNEAKIIDDFFSMYGYATNRLKKPNRAVRETWTYTKTVDCVIAGSVPADDANKICKIYDNGITFWRSLGNIGNYNQPNNIDIAE